MHMRKHTGEKPFRCEVGMKYFQRKANLKAHSTAEARELKDHLKLKIKDFELKIFLCSNQK